MARLDLPPMAYDALQNFANRRHAAAGRIIQEAYAPHRGQPALELGCGTGALSEFFEVGYYAGVDLDARRIRAAKAQHPGHGFIAGDATTLEPEFLARFPFVFCHAWIHHLRWDRIERLLDRLGRVGRPIDFLAIEPLLPDRALRNPLGYLLAKLDRGEHVRSLSEMRRLFGQELVDVQVSRGPWYWPIPGAAFTLRFGA